MTFVLLPDEYLDDDRLLDVSRSDRQLFLELLIWQQRALSDGVIDRRRLGRITDHEDPNSAADRLVAAGLLDPVDDTVRITGDYLQHQQDRETVERKRTQAAARKARWRAHKDGDHSGCRPEHKCHAAVAAARTPSNATQPTDPPVSTGAPAKAGNAPPMPVPAAMGALLDSLGMTWTYEEFAEDEGGGWQIESTKGVHPRVTFSGDDDVVTYGSIDSVATDADFTDADFETWFAPIDSAAQQIAYGTEIVADWSEGSYLLRRNDDGAMNTDHLRQIVPQLVRLLGNLTLPEGVLAA